MNYSETPLPPFIVGGLIDRGVESPPVIGETIPSLNSFILLYGCFFSAIFRLYIAVKVDGFLLFVLVSCYIRIYLFEVHRMEKKEKY